MSERRASPKAIKKRLIDTGETVAGVARELGVTRHYLSMVIHGTRTGSRIRRELCRRLGLRMDRAFPRKG